MTLNCSDLCLNETNRPQTFHTHLTSIAIDSCDLLVITLICYLETQLYTKIFFTIQWNGQKSETGKEMSDDFDDRFSVISKTNALLEFSLP